MAGLSFFAGLLPAADGIGPAEEAPPVRRIAPSPTPQPVVRPADLDAAEKSLKQGIQEAVKRSEEADLAIKKNLEGLRQDVEEIGRKVEKLGKLQGDQQVLLDRQAKETSAYVELLDALKLDVAKTLKKAEEARADVERKGEKMEGLLDLASTLKRDLNDNSHEIVELKAALEKVKARQGVPEDEPEWYDKVLRWRYLPATAAALSVIAIGVASVK